MDPSPKSKVAPKKKSTNQKVAADPKNQGDQPGEYDGDSERFKKPGQVEGGVMKKLSAVESK